MLTYIAIALGGMVVLLFSLVFGGDGHDGDGGMDHHVDGVDVAGHAGGHDYGDLSGWFSIKVFAAFAVGFGSAGCIAVSLKLAPHWQVASGIGVGIAMAILARLIIRLFMKSESSSHEREGSLLNQKGNVTQTILAGRVGEVEVKGQFRSARAASGEEVKSGTPVRVTATGSVLTVEPEKSA